MEARKREVEEERAAAEAAQVRLMEQLSARQEAQVRAMRAERTAHRASSERHARKPFVICITISSCTRLPA